MANNQNVNKVVYGNTTLIDLTSDTVESSVLLEGYTAHDKSGAVVTGSLAIATTAEVEEYFGLN
jgi:hypothetical protein